MSHLSSTAQGRTQNGWESRQRCFGNRLIQDMGQIEGIQVKSHHSSKASTARTVDVERQEGKSHQKESDEKDKPLILKFSSS